MVEYSEVNIKLTDSQLNQHKTAVKNDKQSALRMSIKMFNGNNLPYDLLLTGRPKKKKKMHLKTTFQMI